MTLCYSKLGVGSSTVGRTLDFIGSRVRTRLGGLASISSEVYISDAVMMCYLFSRSAVILGWYQPVLVGLLQHCALQVLQISSCHNLTSRDMSEIYLKVSLSPNTNKQIIIIKVYQLKCFNTDLYFL